MGALTGPMEVMVCASGGRERGGNCAIRPISGPKGGPLEGSAWRLRGPVPVCSCWPLHRLAPRANQRLQCLASLDASTEFTLSVLAMTGQESGEVQGPG